MPTTSCLWTALIDHLAAQARQEMLGGGRFQEVATLYIGNKDEVTTMEHPWLWIYYDNPAITEDNTTSNRGISGTHHLMIEGAIDYEKSAFDKIYGSSAGGVRGPLMLAARVLDWVGSLALNTQERLHVQSWTATVEGMDAEIGEGIGGFLIRWDIVQKYHNQERLLVTA
jgi:hypothetical protein